MNFRNWRTTCSITCSLYRSNSFSQLDLGCDSPFLHIWAQEIVLQIVCLEYESSFTILSIFRPHFVAPIISALLYRVNSFQPRVFLDISCSGTRGGAKMLNRKLREGFDATRFYMSGANLVPLLESKKPVHFTTSLLICRAKAICARTKPGNNKDLIDFQILHTPISILVTETKGSGNTLKYAKGFHYRWLLPFASSFEYTRNKFILRREWLVTECLNSNKRNGVYLIAEGKMCCIFFWAQHHLLSTPVVSQRRNEAGKFRKQANCSTVVISL